MTGSNKSVDFKHVLWLVNWVRCRWIHTVIPPRSIINRDTNLTSLLFRSGTNYSLLYWWISSSIARDVLLHHRHQTIIVDLLLLPVMKPTRCNAYNGSLYLNCINSLLSKFSSLKFWFRVQSLLIHQAIIIYTVTHSSIP